MNIWDYCVIALLLVAIFFAVRAIRRRKGSGCGGCSGCDGCSRNAHGCNAGQGYKKKEDE